MMILSLWTLVLLAGAVIGADVCYDRIGCFPDNAPWAGTTERPIKKMPWSPDRINTRFLMFTKQNPTSFQEVNARNPNTISFSNFQTSRKSRFIIHGFIDKGEESWLTDMCKAMLSVEDVNCFCVDWSGGSRTLYTQAANNVRVVGAEVAYFVDVLSSNFGYSPSNVHVIGHSLGAQAAGEVGKRRRGLGRITGLDPAEPYFQGTPIEVRLDPSDALFVDVIHTDAAPVIPNLGLGTSQLVGHLDFFPNGGEKMPGCKKNVLSKIIDLDGIWQGTRDFFACNHLRSYKYYTESITSREGFIGFKTNSQSSLNSGGGFPCPRGSGCPLMGHYADNFTGVTSSSQRFYLNTGEMKSFSRWRYKVTVQITASRDTKGYFNIALYGTSGNTRQYQIYSGSLRSGASHTAFIDVEADVGTLTRVKFLWDNNIINVLLPKVGATSVTVQYGKDGRSYRFCGNDRVKENVLQTLRLC
uniref:Triacylglycerol lipase n=1 Tax=Leptobrachium leishanense TaxID=445787 RepID=A0A8C5WI38_9ANUR